MDIVTGHPIVGPHMIQLDVLLDATHRRTIDPDYR